MNYYLVTSDQIFVDPRGGSDDGGTTKEVIKLDFDIKTELMYKESIHEYSPKYLEEIHEDEDVVWQDFEDEELEGSEDGYNMTYYRIHYRKITEEQYKKYKKIIKDYKSL